MARLRSVAADEVPPPAPDPITSVTDAVLRGSPVDVAFQSLLVATRILDDSQTPAVARVAALNRVSELQRNLAELKAAEVEETREHTQAPDEALDPAAV